MKLLTGLFLLITGTHCANILIVYETARRSHQIWIGELAEGLMKRGHNITMGGSFSRAIEETVRYHPIPFEGIFLTHYKINQSQHLTSNPLKRLHLKHDYNYAICNRTYHSNGFNTLWNYPDNFTFDLILMDMTFGSCLYPLIQRFGSPYTIGFTPSGLTPYLSEIFGNGGYPSYIVSPLLESSIEDSFFTRLTNYIFTKFEVWFKRTLETRTLEKLAENLLNDTFNFAELEKSISLLFVNEHSLLNEPQALTPNIIPIGGIHIRKVEDLPGILHAIVENANQGIVFFSTGTDIQQNIFSKETKEEFANAFIRLVQKTVIWKDKMQPDERHQFDDKPSNIMIHKWMPQNDLLGHVHTKLLITTGGTLSIQEALYHGVPVVGIPIYDEHHKNMKFIVDNKLGLTLDYNNLNQDTIYEAVNTVLMNPIYLENAFKFATKFRDQSENPLQKALYWVEYALRHNATRGADFLTPKSRYMCSMAAYSVDVQLFLFSTFVIGVVLLIVIFVKILLRYLRKNNVSKSVSDKKKKE